MRRLISALLLLTLLAPGAALGAEDYTMGPMAVPDGMTPACRSETPMDHKNCFWCTPMDITDEKAVWGMLTAPVTVVDLDYKKQTPVYAEPDENSEKIGVVTGQSQSVHVLEKRDDGWTKIETYSSSFFDSEVKNFNAFIVGYIRSNKLKTVQVNQNYGIVIDKLTQRLYLFKDGRLETSLVVSTGLYNDKQPYNETRSGEYLIIYTKTGQLKEKNSRMICDYALLYNQADYIHEVPYNKYDRSKDYTPYEPKLGQRASHGCIRVQAKKNLNGYNMAKLSDLIKNRKDKNCVKIVIWEDYQGRQVAIPSDDTPVYYNPKGGVNYHAVANCPGVKKSVLPLTAFTYGELDDGAYAKLTPCPYCQPVPRKADLEEINRVHQEGSPGDVMSYYPGN